ncbi:hypothetical protein FZF29_00180 [Salmonella enterica subsp. enterica serovar Brunei]|nr:hypothetical protein [Salmonella enterica subsp. enterica serovar Brunei]EEJ6414808.1 hypothetical protein [Salmonella enterica subsp. enterica]ELF8989272.1 hypothetical protein [Salmonella enterica]
MNKEREIFAKKQFEYRIESAFSVWQDMLTKATQEGTGAGREHVDMCGELFEIALASLTAEAVAWTDEQELRDVEKGGCGYLFTVNRAGTVTGISVFHVFFHMVWRVYA